MQIRHPYPLSAVMKTRATFLPDAVFLDKFASSLNVQEEMLVPAAFARVEMASRGYIASRVSSSHNTHKQQYRPQQDTGSMQSYRYVRCGPQMHLIRD